MVNRPKFDAAWQRRRRLAAVGRWARTFVPLAAILLLGWWLTSAPAEPEGEWEEMQLGFGICGEGGFEACVIDGDTIAIDRRRIRLAGFDTPEIDGDCIEERTLAREARAELALWLNSGAFLVDGGASPPRDEYGRELRKVRRVIEGEDQWLAEWMEEKGYSRPREFGAGKTDWCTED
ncbi:thermonuclease family protein [Erythrobacter sp. HKB08]|uniref:thermonuclease family protein n=1 Tax=Erythrobacter sp. HKB08 TaxID=2502843 RepID=UPI001008CF3A|nr:hypothetical protein [Erythrobacter sp. HKB08]